MLAISVSRYVIATCTCNCWTDCTVGPQLPLIVISCSVSKFDMAVSAAVHQLASLSLMEFRWSSVLLSIKGNLLKSAIFFCVNKFKTARALTTSGRIKLLDTPLTAKSEYIPYSSASPDDSVCNNGGNSLQIANTMLMQRPPSVTRLHYLQLGENEEKPGCPSMPLPFGGIINNFLTLVMVLKKYILISFTDAAAWIEASCNLWQEQWM